MSVHDRLRSPVATRILALVSVAALLGASLQVLYHFIDVTGVPTFFVVVVAATLLAATVLSWLLRPWMAVVVGAVLLAAGLVWYLSQIAGNPPWESLLADAIALFFGRSLLHINGINAWVLGVAPAPIFLTWYFAMRRTYVAAVLVAGGTLGFFVLTTDADAVTTLSGVVAGTAALALGDLERRGEPVVRAETVAAVIAVMILVPVVVSVVPAGAGAQVSLSDGLFGEDATLESSLMTDERVGIQGSITLSPEVRYTVESEQEAYWRVASYDRYTGDGWIRTGSLEPSDGSLSGPEEPSQTVEQTYRAETELQRTPAAWKPVSVTGFDGDLVETADGSIQPASALSEGESYRVRSQVPAATPQQLQAAGTDYPTFVRDHYTQLPSSTPDRVADRTEVLTADAETPYETALTIEQWLENNREYSLSVREPRGDVADAFLFEMDSGYCTYYATTMVTMLRSQDVPARFVSGYSAGQQVSEDEWVVRGLNSHAWVEVYFPEHGWQRFDPTPSGPRVEARTGSVEAARDGGVPGVDTNDTGEQPDEDDGSGTPQAPDVDNLPGEEGGETTVDPVNGSTPNDVPDPSVFGYETPPPEPDGTDTEPGPRLPTGQQFTLAALAVVGAAVGLRRTRAARRAYRAVWLRYQPRADPAADVERAFQRVLYHTRRTAARDRDPEETVREYFEALDAAPNARRVALLRERARYAGEVTAAEADEAVRLANELVR